MNAPSSRLTYPEPGEAIPESLDAVLEVAAWTSIGGALMKAVELVTGGVNPGTWVGEQYTGDWTKIAGSGKAVGKLADFDDACAAELGKSTRAVLNHWDCAASESAETYFADLGDRLTAHAETMRLLAGELHQLAMGAYNGAAAVSSLLTFLMDQLIMIVLDEIAAIAAPGWGTVAAYAKLIADVFRAQNTWVKVLKNIDNTMWVLQSTDAVVIGYLTQFTDARLELPQRSFTAIEAPA